MSVAPVDHDAAEGLPSGSKRQLVSPLDARADIARFVRAQCIQRREPSLEQLASLSGIKLNRLRRLIASDEDDPRWWRFDEVLSVWAVLRAPAASASLARIGMAADDDEDRAKVETLLTAAGQLLKGSGDLLQCSEDFRIRRSETGRVERAAASVREAVATMVRAAKRARR